MKGKTTLARNFISYTDKFRNVMNHVNLNNIFVYKFFALFSIRRMEKKFFLCQFNNHKFNVLLFLRFKLLRKTNIVIHVASRASWHDIFAFMVDIISILNDRRNFACFFFNF